MGLPAPHGEPWLCWDPAPRPEILAEIEMDMHLKLFHCEHCGNIGQTESEIFHTDCAAENVDEMHPNAVVSLRVMDVTVHGLAV